MPSAVQSPVRSATLTADRKRTLRQSTAHLPNLKQLRTKKKPKVRPRAKTQIVKKKTALIAVRDKKILDVRSRWKDEVDSTVRFFIEQKQNYTPSPDRHAQVLQNILRHKHKDPLRAAYKLSKLDHPTKRTEMFDEASTLNARFVQLYLESYQQDKSKFNSIEEFAVVKLNELSVLDRTRKVPNRLRTAICCDLLESLVHDESRYAPVLERLKLEIFQSIYRGAALPADQIGTQVFGSEKIFREIPFFIEVDRERNKNKPRRRSTVNIDAMLASALTDADIQSLQTRYFGKWKLFSNQSAQRRAHLEATRSLSRLRHEYDQKVKWFRGWKDFITKTKYDRLEFQYDQTKLQLKEASGAVKKLSHDMFKTKSQIQRLKFLKSRAAMDEQRDKDAEIFRGIMTSQAHKLRLWLQKLRNVLNSSHFVDTSKFLNDGETSAYLLQSLSEEEIVLRWINYQLSQINTEMLSGLPIRKEIHDLSADLNDGSVLCMLMSRALGEPTVNFKELSMCFDSTLKRQTCEHILKRMLSFGDHLLVTFRDLMRNRADTIFVFLVNLMNQHPMMSATQTEEVGDLMLKLEVYMTRLSALHDSTNISAMSNLVTECQLVEEHVRKWYDAINSNHEQWLQTLRRLQTKAFHCLAARRDGHAMLIEDRTVKQFSRQILTIRTLKLKSLFDYAIGENPSDVEGVVTLTSFLENEVEKCKKVLQAHVQDIQRAFLSFASMDGDNNFISKYELQALVDECKIKDRRITAKFLSKAVTHCRMTSVAFCEQLYEMDVSSVTELFAEDLIQQEMNPIKEGEDHGRSIHLAEFTEWIFRVAAKKYNNISDMSERLQKLLEFHILRYAGVGGDALRDQIQSHQCRVLFKGLEYPLKEAFNHYASERNASKSEKRLTEKDLNILLNELQLVSARLPKRVVDRVFLQAALQSDGHRMGFTKDRGGVLNFHQFCEVLAVIAIHKRPDPYLPLNVRIEEFLRHSIIKPLVAKKRIIGSNRAGKRGLSR